MRVWALTEGFPCLAALQVADLRGSVKALAATGDMLFVGGQSCHVMAYKLSPPHVAHDGANGGTNGGTWSPVANGAGAGGSALVTPTVPPSPPDDLNAAAAAARDCSGPTGLELLASGIVGGANGCGGPSSETIRAMVGSAQPPCAASDPQHSHCGSITALAVCGPYVFSASTDSTVRVWTADGLRFVKVLRGHRGSVLALYGGPGIVLRWGWPRSGVATPCCPLRCLAC